MSTFKKSISIILAALMMLSVFVVAPISASAESIKSGLVGDCKYYYYPSNHTLVIKEGTKIEADQDGNYPWRNTNWKGFYDEIEAVEIMEGITSIGAMAFDTSEKIKSVKLPSTLKEIKAGAFYQCTGLQSVTLPEGVETIGTSAFYRCTSLKSLKLPVGIKSLNTFSFDRCTSLAELTIPDGFTAPLCNDAFRRTALKSVYVPDSVSRIDPAALGYDYSKSDGYKPVSDFTIICKKKSAADTYATKNGFNTKYLVTNVDFTNVFEPEVGKTAEFSFVTASEGFTVYGKKIEWRNMTDDTVLKEGDKFVEGKQYGAFFDLIIKDGYQFAVKENGNTAVASTVNGDKAATLEYTQADARERLRIRRTFPPVSASDVVKTVAVTGVTEPTVGSNPSLSVKLPDNVKLYNMYWQENGKTASMTSTDIFEYGKTYEARIYISPAEGKKFSFNGDAPVVSATVNGKAASKVVKGSTTDRIGIFATYTTPASSAQAAVISNIAFTNVVEPRIGAEPDFTFKSSAGFKERYDKVEWRNLTDEVDVKAGDKFEEGKQYAAYFHINSNSGYAFAKNGTATAVNATVNGDKAAVYAGGTDPANSLVVRRTFPVLEVQTIYNVAVTNVAEPKAGEVPTFTCTLPEGVEVHTFNYYDQHGDSVGKKGFKSGYEYYVEFWLTAKTGYKFAVKDKKLNITASINGETVTASPFNAAHPEEEICLTLCFPKLIDPDNPTVLSKTSFILDEPVAGESPKSGALSYTGIEGATVMWINPAGSWMDDSDVFEAGKTYKARVFFTAESGFAIANDGTVPTITVTVNGKDADKVMRVASWDPAYGACAEISLTAVKNTISKVLITDVVEPVVGAYPVKEAVVPAGTSFYRVDWINNTNGGNYMKSGEQFDYDKEYIVRVILKADENHQFAVDGGKIAVTAKINGKTASEILKVDGEEPADCISIRLKFKTPSVTDTQTETETETETETVTETETETETKTEPKETETVTDKPIETETTTEPKETETVTDKPIETETTTEPKETETVTDKPIETETTTEPVPENQVFSYLPSTEQAAAGNSFKLEVKDADGNVTAYDMTPTGETIDGVTVYRVEIPANKNIVELSYQVYDGENWVSQFTAALADVLGKIVKSDGTTVDTTPTNPTETDKPVPSNDIGYFKLTGVKNKTYTGKAVTQKITIIDEENNYTLVGDTDYIVTYKDNKKVGTATMIITAVGDFEGSIIKTFKIKKAKKPTTVKTAKKTVKLKDVKKKTVTVKKAFTVKGAKGKLSYTRVKKGSSKYLLLSKKGKVTVKKGAKKGTYTIIIKITAKGTKNYKKKSVTKKVTVKVK